MDKLERFAYWKSVALDALRAAGRDGVAEFEAIEFKNEDDLFLYFDNFRPDGRGLEKVFAGVVGGDEIVQRLLRVYACTKESFLRFYYFIVCRPARASIDQLVYLTEQHLDKAMQIAILTGEIELVSLLEKSPEIKICREGIPEQTLREFHKFPEAFLYERMGDWCIDLKPRPSDALLLGEAFYSIACDYNISRHLLWPLYRHCTDIEDPFAPYFELWTLGARPWFEKPGLVTVYVPGDL